MGSRSRSRSSRNDSPPRRSARHHRSKSRSRTSEYPGEDSTRGSGNSDGRLRGDDNDAGLRGGAVTSKNSKSYSKRTPAPSAPFHDEFDDFDDAASTAGAVPPSNAGSLYHAPPGQLSHQPSMKFPSAAPPSSAGPTRECSDLLITWTDLVS